MNGAKAEKAAEFACLRELFIKRMTIDSETTDGRRKDFNQAIFGVNPDGSTYQCFYGTDMQMVLRCFDDATRDYFDGLAEGEKGRRARGNLHTHTREGNFHA